MTTTPKALIEAKFAEAVETVQYPSTDCKTSIDKCTVTNVTGLNATIAVSIVPAAGVAGPSNRVTFTRTIAPGATHTFPELVGHIMESGDFISTLAGTVNALVIRASGRQFT